MKSSKEDVTSNWNPARSSKLNKLTSIVPVLDTPAPGTKYEISIEPPDESEKTISLNPEASPAKSNVVKVPHPAGTVDPVNEKPNTVDPAVDTWNPASAAAPPAALFAVVPSTSN